MRLFHIAVLCAGASLASGTRVAHALLPVPLQSQESADSVYTRARRALDDKNYDAAARLFNSILSRYPRSVYAPDALYWVGFALYRGGNLEGAQTALESQAERFPNAPTRADAAPLLIAVKGELARRGDATARREVDSAASASSGQDACGDMEVRIAALDALQQMDSERVLPLLRRVMARRDECSAPLRKNALFILAQKGGTERDKMLLEIAKSDPNTAVRNDAVFYLGQTKSEAAVDALEDILLRGDERGVRGNALFALAQVRSERTTRILQQFVLADNMPMALRNDALFHSAAHPGVETNKWLVMVINNPRAPMEVRKNAIFFLAQRKNDATGELYTVLESALPLELRKDMLFYISQRRDDRAITKLIAIARSDPSQEMRKDALFFLAQSKDPRALKAIEDMVIP